MRNASLGTRRPWLFSVVSKILKTPALDSTQRTLLLNKCPLQLLLAFSRRVGASVFAKKKNSPLGDRRKIEGLRFFWGKNPSQIRQISTKNKLLRSPYLDDYIPAFASCQYSTVFFLTCSQILAKSSCGVSPVHVPHEIEEKKNPPGTWRT